ncbi:MAG: hypothetical protein NC293_13105 [Roseburia sp.]|nr:hypothetical protein [Roseburia sp.]
MRKIIVVSVLVFSLLCGCGQSVPEQGGAKGLDSYGASITVKDIKEKYNYADNSIMPLYNVSPGETFDFSFSYDLSEAEDADRAVTVHTDESCSEESMISTYYNVEKTETGSKVSVSPVAGVLLTKTEDEEYIEEDKGVWGNAPMYYIAVHQDMESDSPKKLEKPRVIPFTVKQELEAPEAKGVVASDGRFKLTWNAVEGAKEYRIYKLIGNEQYTGDENKPVEGAKTGYSECSLLYEASTDQTEFDDFSGKGSGLAVQEDKMSGEEFVIGQNYSVDGEYYVSAVIGDQESGFCGGIPTAELKLPHEFTEEDDLMYKEFQSVSDLPLVREVVNIDGTVTKRKVLYRFYKRKTWTGEEVPGYQYQIEGTALTGCVSMEDIHAEYPETVGDSTPSGNVEPENNVERKPGTDLPTILNPDETQKDDGISEEDQNLIERQKENTSQHVDKGNESSVDNPGAEVKLFADSAEEEWLALNLVSGETEISVEAFPALQNAENLEDAFYKVYYQNPYILGLSRFSYDYTTMTLHVFYSYDKSEIQKKQKEMSEAGEAIISEIIKEDMSAEEKENAVYQYLTDHGQYDTEALEDAKKNNFQKTEDSSYEDSFNGYGILVNQKGVCQSYAYAYKLLCELGGVPCRVMTGNLDGNLPHAWNAVRLGDEWFQTDSTNNEKTAGIPYFLYNADSNTAELTGFDPDANFEMDDRLSEYHTENDGYEYYKVNQLVAGSMEQYEEILDRVLNEPKDIISIRYTEGNVDQEQLVAAVQRVYNKHGMEDKLAALKCGIQSRYIILQ